MRNLNCVLLSILFLFIPMATLAGDLDSPAAPTSAGSAMYTLEAIYDRLNAGTAGAKRTGAFTEPSSGPTAGTGHTFDEVMSKAPSVDNANGAGVADVLANKTFWGLTSGAWGSKTGTMTNNGTGSTITPGTSNQTVAAGYWASANTVSGDADLAAGNIKDSVVIFGVTGNYPLAGAAKTGQTTSYATGDDGDLEKGVVWPNPRFTVGSGAEAGTVTDNLTGLMWAEDADAAGTKKWYDIGQDPEYPALAYCNDLSLGGHDDWRLPNVKELQSLIDFAYSSPALSNAAGTAQWTTDGDAFTDVQSNYYWSSTTAANATSNAFFVHLFRGRVASDSKTNSYYVWPVRGGQ